MRKKHVLLIGILILMVFCGIPKKVNAETEEVYTLEGNITYDKDNWRDFNGTKEEWEILFNISIPIPLKSGRDTLYWHNIFSGNCDSLTIIFYFRPIPEGGSGGDSFYIHPDDNNICDMRKYHDAGNFVPDNRDNTFVLVKRRGFLNPKGYLYHLTWKFWIERDIVENQPDDVIKIGINIIPFLLGFMCIGVIIVYTEKIKN